MTPGTRYRIRLINAAADNVLQFSIDGHPLTIIAIDGTYVQKKTVDVVALDAGQVPQQLLRL